MTDEKRVNRLVEPLDEVVDWAAEPASRLSWEELREIDLSVDEELSGGELERRREEGKRRARKER